MNFVQRIEETFAADPAAIALTTAEGSWTFASLMAGARAWARRTESLGIAAGERIVLCLDNSADFLALYLGHLLTGRVTVPVNTAYRAAELAHIVRVARPRLIVAEERQRATTEEALAGMADAPAVIYRQRPFMPALAEESGGAIPAPANDALGALVFTSGTTGRPKAARISQSMMLASGEALRTAWKLGREDHLLLALPLFHVHGLCVGVNGLLIAGHRITLHAHFDQAAVVAQLSQPDGPTLFYGVPTFYARILAEAPAGARFPNVRLFVSGSAPLSAEMKERFRERFCARILERYGMTETLMNISQRPDGERRAGSVGVPLPGVSVRIAGEDGVPVPDGTEGEILVAGANVFDGYFDDPAATAASFTADGFFRTGDLARRAADGEIEITGRKKEMIISGGLKIHPREVEECLATHAAVRECAVAGFADPDLGEAVGAMVVPHPGAVPAPESLIAHCRDRLASFKKPRRIIFAGSLPRNALGKIVRADVRRALEAAT